MVLVIHNVRSIFNVGSIFRTADALGVKKIYLCGITPAPLDRLGKPRPQFVKVSLGAEKTVIWEKVSSTTAIIDKLHKDGYKVFAVEQSSKSIPYFKLKSLPKKYALVLGNEVRGLPPGVLKKCDKILEIPMRGEKESLNVAMSFGIVGAHLIYNVKHA